MPDFSHFDDEGRSRMVDVSAKPVSHRLARVRGSVTMSPATQEAIRQRRLQKGDVLEIARIAGIMSAKKTAELIPLCHPVKLDSVEIEFEFVDQQSLAIESKVSAHDRTGVEMEAFTAASVAALTVYDMCKSIDRGMVITGFKLIEKSGGKSGHYVDQAEK